MTTTNKYTKKRGNNGSHKDLEESQNVSIAFRDFDLFTKRNRFGNTISHVRTIVYEVKYYLEQASMLELLLP